MIALCFIFQLAIAALAANGQETLLCASEELQGYISGRNTSRLATICSASRTERQRDLNFALQPIENYYCVSESSNIVESCSVTEDSVRILLASPVSVYIVSIETDVGLFTSSNLPDMSVGNRSSQSKCNVCRIANGRHLLHILCPEDSVGDVILINNVKVGPFERFNLCRPKIFVHEGLTHPGISHPGITRESSSQQAEQDKGDNQSLLVKVLGVGCGIGFLAAFLLLIYSIRMKRRLKNEVLRLRKNSQDDSQKMSSTNGGQGEPYRFQHAKSVARNSASKSQSPPNGFMLTFHPECKDNYYEDIPHSGPSYSVPVDDRNLYDEASSCKY